MFLVAYAAIGGLIEYHDKTKCYFIVSMQFLFPARVDSVSFISGFI